MSRSPLIITASALGVVLLGLSAVTGWPVLLTLPAGLALGFGGGAAWASRGTASPRTPAAASATVPQKTSPTLAALRDLELRAKVRGDLETAGLLDRLEALFDRLRAAEAEAERDEKVLAYKLRQMYDNAAQFCDRALSLHLARREMATNEGREKVDTQRRALLDEVTAAVAGIESAIDRLRANTHTAGDADRRADLADLNKDLDLRLEVARRVDQRMSELERRPGVAFRE